MKIPSNLYVRIAIALSSLGGYALIFPILYPFAGPATAALNFIPSIITGWFLGIPGSLVFGILNFPLNTFLLNLVGDTASANNFIAAILSNIALTLLGVTAAWIRKLVDRVNNQTKELQKEHNTLQEEIEKRSKAEERLTYEALHDPLTNLPNRKLLIDRLAHASEWNKRHPNDLFAVLYLDFDRFKVINDSLGHNIGDQVLVEMARRLKSSVRATDTVARMGGDEFAILLESAKSDKEVIAIVRRLQERLVAPFEVEGNTIVLTASIGIVDNLLRYERIEDIVRDADIAMYSAKVSGRNLFEVFDVGMREQADNILKLESGLRNALRNGEFRIHYQQVISLKAQLLTGFEALLRWEHPVRGLLYPADFLRVAEESGLIVPIGQWVLQEACQQMKKWQTQFNLDPPLTISINLSSRQFMHPDLVRQIDKVLKETALPARSLLLELTEMTLIEDIETAIVKIEQLRTLGVGVEIDDFGTGYSSLGYLRHLPVHTLKIDRSFVSTLGSSKSAVPIIRAIIAMANSLDMKVIAEGIETKDQVSNLMALECDYGQGFFFNKPVDAEAAQEMIKERFSKKRR